MSGSPFAANSFEPITVGEPRGYSQERAKGCSVELPLWEESLMTYEERETGDLIGSDKVEGTAVYGPDDQRIGSMNG
jgi:hypothetical protein